MLNTWSDQALRNAQPVLMVVSCLCLCLGSCFPSSEPLNRISATQSNTPTMSSLSSSSSSSSSGRETVHDVVAVTVTSSTVSNVVFNVDSDARVRNLDNVVQERLASVGQIASSSTTSAASTIERNSTREGDNSLPSLSSSSSSSSTSSSNGDREKQRRPKVKRKKSMREQSSHLTQKYKSRAPKRRRLPSERKGKTREELGLDARAGRRNRRTQRLDCARLKKRSSLIRQLENSLSFFLAVYPDGTVNGTTNRSDCHTLLSFIAYRRGFVRLYGEKAERFVCMDNRTGSVYASEYARNECVFFEALQTRNLMNTYSMIHSPKRSIEWYLSITKRGQVKNGKRVKSLVKIAQFLPSLVPEEMNCCR